MFSRFQNRVVDWFGNLKIIAGTKTPALEIAQTWNNSGVTFSGLKLTVTNTASSAASLLFDAQVGGSSQLSLTKAGRLDFTANAAAQNKSSIKIAGQYSDIYIGAYAGVLIMATGDDISSSANCRIGPIDISLASTGFIGFASSATSAVGSGSDVSLARDGQGILAQRNGTNVAQTFNIYNTYTNASNYERGFLKWNSNVLEIGTEKAGTGTLRGIRIGVTGNSIGFIGATPAAQIAHVADASTAHAITDPADSPADADALREDLVSNVIPSLETALNSLGTKINTILTTLESFGFHASA